MNEMNETLKKMNNLIEKEWKRREGKNLAFLGEC